MDTIQKVLGITNTEEPSSPKKRYTHHHDTTTSSHKKDKPGIDVVLGSQWGDEGKGKLVDILSQVRNKYYFVVVGERERSGCDNNIV